jgi:bifunctional ADP-heptose synthase (sugar kinase/adenylyltransferase)
MSYKNDLFELFTEIQNLRVLLIGETIIDEYVFVAAKGRATKDPILSTGYIEEEKYLGGVLAPARHLAEFVEKVHVISLLGEFKTNSDYILSRLKYNIEFDYFTKLNSPTIVKRRYVDPAHYHKLFKVEYLNDEVISEELSYQIIDRIEDIKDEYDLILVNDFGHGLFSDILTDYISKLNIFVALNVQTNSSNYGYNPFTKYKKADFISMNESELLLPFHNKNLNYLDILKRVIREDNFHEILVTLGKKGAAFYRNEIKFAGSLISNPIDTIGAGDAVFSLTSLLSYLEKNETFILKFANIVGATAVGILGNKKSITKRALLKYVGQNDELE